MSTLEFVSTSAHGIAESAVPLVTAPALVAALGTQPALTVPLVSGNEPATTIIWQRLDEAARFFGTAIPSATALDDTLRRFLDEAASRHGRVTLAARVMAVEVDGGQQFMVSATVIEPVRVTPVVLAVTPDRGSAGPEPQWRRMAGRTASSAEADRAERDLNASGFADSVAVDGEQVSRPMLGALIIDTVGVGADRLELLAAAGLLDGVSYADDAVALDGVAHVQWVSPRFERHPVSAIGAHLFEVVRP